jgi:hypothetical protein
MSVRIANLKQAKTVRDLKHGQKNSLDQSGCMGLHRGQGGSASVNDGGKLGFASAQAF